MLLTVPTDESSAYMPKRELPEKMKQSFFRDVYETAEQHISNILEQFDCASDKNLAEYSNILSFTGGRGVGKTSAMLNTAELLRHGKKLDGSSWCKIHFVCLPMVDPTHISSEETIIDIILAHMYNEFYAHCSGKRYSTEEIPQEKQRETYQAFEKTYSAVRAMCQSRVTRYSEYNSLENLQYTAAGNNLRKLLHTLVQLFLNIMTPAGYDKSCMVVCVDDVDINARQGYDICEELRKYLSIPSVVILFSLCMDQMNDLVRQQYLKDFDVLLKHRDELPLADSISHMAEKYLQKLIPFGHRCALPTMELQDQAGIEVQYEMSDGKPTGQTKPLVDEVLSLLYEKTGLLLVKDERGTHGFLPTTLRGIVHLLMLLNRMKPVRLIEANPDKTDDGKCAYRLRQLSQTECNTLKSNLHTITRYIQEYGIAELPQNSAKVLNILLKEPECSLNQHVVRTMIHEMKGLYSETKHGFSEFLSEQMPPENVSVGDMLYVMRVYTQVSHYYDGQDKRFSALFKALYSARILQSFFLGKSEAEPLSDRKDRLFQLLGGLIYSPDRDTMLPISQEDLGKIRGQRIVNLKEWLEKKPDGADNLVDAILIGTIYMGASFPHHYGGFTVKSDTFRLQSMTPFYEDISREAIIGKLGNTYKYFGFSYFGSILNSLRSDLEIHNDSYNNWRNNFLSILPVWSADFMDAYVSGIYRATRNLRKSGLCITETVIVGSHNLVCQLLDRVCADADSLAYWGAANGDFPVLDIDSDEYLLQVGALEPVRPKDVEKKIISLNICIRNLNRARTRYREYPDISALRRGVGATSSTEGLLSAEKELIIALNRDIKAYTAGLADDAEPLQQLEEAKAYIVQRYDSALQYAEQQKAAAEKQLKELEQDGRV